MESVPIAAARASQAPAPARQFSFTAKQWSAVVAAYQADQSMASLAAEYGTKRESISKLLRREGVALRVRRAMSPAEIDQAAQLYERGLSLHTIGSHLNWDHNTIYRHLKKRGVMMRGPNDWQH